MAICSLLAWIENLLVIFSKIKPRHIHHCFDLFNDIIHSLICVCIPLFIFGDSSGEINYIIPERFSGT